MSEIKERATAAPHEPEETDAVSISLDYIKRSMDGFGLSMRHAQWLIAEVERANMWKNAVIDACVVSWVLKKEHEHNPKLAVNDLCAWCHSVALDPKVSSDTKKLYDRIAELKAENDALKDAIQSDSPLRLACLGDMNDAYVYEKKLYDAAKFLALNQFEEPT